jgi:NAD(P)-dependent dehydrogenase (short-subunit alcohol dehydrogenase family)
VQLDVRDLGQWEAAVAATVKRFGKLTTLCNIAGISEPGNTVDVDLDSWHRHIDINLTGSFYGCRAALPALAASGEAATIVNVGSMLAHRASATMAAYCASKAGVTHLTRTVALDCAARGLNIRANTVHPGAIRTPMYERYLQAGGPDMVAEIEKVMASAHPMGRVGTPEEVAQAILFLSCDESSFTSGTDLNVDGASAIRQ